MDMNAGGVAAPGSSAVTPRPGVWLTEASLLLMATIWGVNFVVVKFATNVLPPLPFNAVRVTLAAVALSLIASQGKSPWPSLRQALTLIGLGMLGNGIYQIF